MRLYEIANRKLDRTIPRTIEQFDQHHETVKIALERYIQGKRIYRGNRFHTSPVAFADPTDVERRSANTSNHTTLFMDNLPSWSAYPKRSRSLVGSTDPGRAGGYAGGSSKGNLYVVLPVGNPVIGICPGEDVFESFPNMDKHLDCIVPDFNDLLEQLPKLFDMNEMNDSSYQNIVQTCHQIDEKRKGQDWDLKILPRYYRDGAEYFLKSSKPMLETIAELLDPNTNGFSVESMSSFSGPDGKEVWVSAPAWLITEPVLQKWLQEKGMIGS